MGAKLGNGHRPHAVVVGLDCMTGLQTAHILNFRHGVPVIGIAAKRNHPCCRTRACEKIEYCDTGGDELIETLAAIGPRLPHRAVLYPCTDLSVLGISRFRSVLAPWFHIALPEPEVVETLVDKCGFYAFAQQHGFAVPATFLLGDIGALDQAAEQLHFPAVLKPSVKLPEWEKHVGAKVFRVQSATELRSLYERCAEYAGSLLVQEWIPGEHHPNFTCNAYFNADSQPLVTFVTQKLREWPLVGGTGCLGQECRNDFVAEETQRFFQAAHHRGFGYLEMKLDSRRGKYFLIEPNIGRPTGRSSTAEAAGVDLLYTQYCDLLGQPLPENREQKNTSVKWIYLRRDFQSALTSWRRGELSVRDWALSLRGPKVEALFSWKDPVPFFADALKGIRMLLGNGKPPSRTAALKSVQPARDLPQPSRTSVDFDVHGLAGIRLINASPADAATVRRQLGPLETVLSRAPEITVRFVDRLSVAGLRYVEVGRNGFTEDGFYILQSRKQPARTRIDFREIGNPCEIVCETGISAVPLLLAILNLTLLTKDCIPLHASAFSFNGIGVVVTGWAKGGKTEALLAFSQRGARYVGDEWVLLTGDGKTAFGIPEHIRLQQWHLAQLPHVGKHLRRSDRAFFRAINLLERFHRTIPERVARRSSIARRLRDALPALRRQLNAQFDPRVVFGESLGPFSMMPQKLFFMVSHDKPGIEVEPADPIQIAERMCASIRYEQLPFFSDYLAYRFAFPDRSNSFLEHVGELQRSLLIRAVSGKEAYVVRHPYPCSLDALFESMSPFCATDVPQPSRGPQQSQERGSQPNSGLRRLTRRLEASGS